MAMYNYPISAENKKTNQALYKSLTTPGYANSADNAANASAVTPTAGTSAVTSPVTSTTGAGSSAYDLLNADAIAQNGGADYQQIYNQLMGSSGSAASTPTTSDAITNAFNTGSTGTNSSWLQRLAQYNAAAGNTSGASHYTSSLGTNANVANYSNQLQQAYNAMLASELAGQAVAYQQNVDELTDAERLARQQYYAARNEIAANNELQRRALNQTLAARGLNTGASGQAALSMSNAYQGAVADNALAEANAQAELDSERRRLAREYNAAIVQAQAENNAELAMALYNEAIRVDEMLQSYKLASM